MLIEHNIISKSAVIPYLKKSFVYKSGPEDTDGDYGKFFRDMLRDIEKDT